MPPLSADDFDYALPSERIAQHPSDKRDASRLLVVDRQSRTLQHRTFSDLPDFLNTGDTLFRNNAAVLPARLSARRPTGGRVECFLLRRVGERPEVWDCLLKPGRRLGLGAIFHGPGEAFVGEVVAKHENGEVRVRFTTREGEDLASVAQLLGEVPLPPYIARAPGAFRAEDRERYQTVYADRGRPVAVAAPTAGLHFTPELLARISERGVTTADLILHVGLGTFRPMATATVEAHPIHREPYEIPAATQAALFPPRNGRRVAVGTTSVRTIEDFLSKHPSASATSVGDEAAVFLYPPCTFRGVDALVTNFHQPRSTLLCLVAAFLTPGSIDGIEWIRVIYNEAIRREYRFLSYGDAMLIL